MLVGIDTGYEGKFDFPRRVEQPERTYLLATVPRTGSTWLSHLLWRTGRLGAPLEYLNFEPAGPYFFAAKSVSAQLQLWQSLLHRRTSPNGVFGIKCFPGQLQALQQANPQLLEQVMSTLLGPSRTIVRLDRRDKVAHAVSLARASISGVWRSDQESTEGTTVEYSELAVDRARRMIEAESSAWEQMFADLRIDPLTIWYEDAIDDPEAAVAAVAGHVGAVLEPSAAVDVPQVNRQSNSNSAEWTARYGSRGAELLL